MYLSSFEIAFEAFCARLRVIEVKTPFFCIVKYVNLLYIVIQASKVDTIQVSLFISKCT
jgi:hypothetical protein